MLLKRSVGAWLGGATAAAWLPGGAGAAGTLDFQCVSGTAGFSPIWAGSSTAQSFPANNSGKLLTVDLKNVSRSSGGTGGDIAVELYGESGGNLVAPLLASTTIPSASIPANGTYQNYTVNFAAGSAAYLSAGQTYGIALRTADSAQNVWGFNAGNPCPAGKLMGGGPPYAPLDSGDWDAGITTYLGPEHDDFARAKTLSGTAPTSTDTTAGGTRESGEPDHYTIGGGDQDSWLGDHSVWYEWQSPGSGTTTIDTCTASIDSILAVYTGSDLASLTRVTDNNNDAGCGGGFGSLVSFQAISGTTYAIAVGDAGGARESTFTLEIAGQANQLPDVSRLKPANGRKIKDRTPKIKATIADPETELTAADIQLAIDGDPKSGFAYDQAKDRLKFQARRLKPGRHEVEVSATDAVDAVGEAAWAFKVKR